MIRVCTVRVGLRALGFFFVVRTRAEDILGFLGFLGQKAVLMSVIRSNWEFAIYTLHDRTEFMPLLVQKVVKC